MESFITGIGLTSITIQWPGGVRWETNVKGRRRLEKARDRNDPLHLDRPNEPGKNPTREPMTSTIGVVDVDILHTKADYVCSRRLSVGTPSESQLTNPECRIHPGLDVFSILTDKR